MPGIAGIIRKSPYEEIGRDLRLMVEAMRHESFYRGSQYVNKDLGLYAGWMGHQGGFSDCMPLISQEKDIVLIFHGENYLDGETLGKIGRSGNNDDSNARYLIDLYTELGDDFVCSLNGWFCGLIVDLRTRKITLLNDRYGMGRIYVHEGKDEFLFASEAKSLLKVRPALRKIRPVSLAQYLRSNCVMGNKTLFEEVTLLPQAALWTFDNGVLSKKQRYFHLSEWERQPALEPDEFYSRFAETVSTVFPSYAEGSRNVGMSLTAGLDTRVIMAALHPDNHLLPCYTFGGTWGETFDIRTAREVAHIFGQPHEVIRINDAFLREFGKYAQRTIYISDGTHDAFGAHDLYFNQIAREIAPIRLTGKFGSEVVRVRRMIPWGNFPRNVLDPDLRAFLDEAPSLCQVSKTKNPLSRAISEEIPWYEYGRVAIEQSQVTLRTPYMDNELINLMFQAPFELRAAGSLQAQYVREKSPPLSAILTNLSRSGKHNRLVKELFYIAFWSLFKLEYIYLFATPHWLTRIDRKLEKLRPERILSGRQKFKGYRIWIKTHFTDFIQQTLLNPKAQFAQFFNSKTVEEMVRRHIAGTHNYLNEINKVLTVELICSSLLKP